MSKALCFVNVVFVEACDNNWAPVMDVKGKLAKGKCCI